MMDHAVGPGPGHYEQRAVWRRGRALVLAALAERGITKSDDTGRWSVQKEN